MKKLFKFMLKSIFIAIIVIVVAIIAAPNFIRQEQVASFIENKILLPDNKKIKIESAIDFGFFPYAHFSTERASIISPDGLKQTIENLMFGFDLKDLITKNIDFDLQAKFQGVDYKANVAVEDYQSFLQSEDTPIDIKFENPVPFTLTGDLKSTKDGKQLKNFTLTHKQTVVKGNIYLKNLSAKAQNISGDITLNTENIDDLRRLADLKNYNDAFNQLSGRGDAVISFSTSGATDYEFKRNLNAEGSLKVSNAAIYGIDLEEYLRSFGQVQFAKDQSKKIDIDNVDAAFIAKQGLVTISNLNAVNKKANAKGAGKIDIADELVNANLTINSSIEGNSVNLPLLITGSLKDPQVKAQAVQAVITNAAQLQQLTGKIKNEKLRNTLQGVFDALGNMGGGVEAPVSQQQPAPQVQPNTNNNNDDPLGGLINSIQGR